MFQAALPILSMLYKFLANDLSTAKMAEKERKICVYKKKAVLLWRNSH